MTLVDNGLRTVDTNSSMMDDQPYQSLAVEKDRQAWQIPPNRERGTYACARVCTSCDFRTFSVQALRTHESLHVKRSQHQCDKCSYSTASRKRLKNHLMDHHLNENPLISQQQVFKKIVNVCVVLNSFYINFKESGK